MVATFVTQSRIASLMASFSVRLPFATPDHFGAQQPHAEDIEALPPHIFFAHVHHALHAKQRADRSGCDAMLAGARFGNDALLCPSAARAESGPGSC